jgi:hypothetical protein
MILSLMIAQSQHSNSVNDCTANDNEASSSDAMPTNADGNLEPDISAPRYGSTEEHCQHLLNIRKTMINAGDPGDPALPKVVAQIMISTRGRHLEMRVYHRLVTFGKIMSERNVTVYEPGDKKEWLHCHQMGMYHIAKTVEHKERMEQLLKKFVPIPERKGYVVQFKFAEPGQTLKWLTGYAFKHEMKCANFTASLFRTPQKFVDEGKREYQIMKCDYMEGKKECCKANAIKDANRFWNHHMKPLNRPSLCRTMQYYHNEGGVLPAPSVIGATWKSGGGGCLDREISERYWTVIHKEPEDISKSDIRHIYFKGDHRAMHKRLLCEEGPLATAHRKRQHRAQMLQVMYHVCMCLSVI